MYSLPLHLIIIHGHDSTDSIYLRIHRNMSTHTILKDRWDNNFLRNSCCNKVLNGNKYFRIQWYLYHNIPLDLPMNNRWGRHCCRVGTCHRGLSPRKDRFWRRFPDQTDISENRCRGWVLFCSASRANNGCRPPRPAHSRWEQLNYYSRWGKTFCSIPCSLNKSSRHSLYRM